MSDIAAAGAELARRTRAAQGLEATIDDPWAVNAIAAIAAGALRRSTASGRPRAGDPGPRTTSPTAGTTRPTDTASLARRTGDKHIAAH